MWQDIRLSPRRLAREILRVAAAFAIYLALRWVWLALSLDAAYESLVFGLASRLFLPFQHFPVIHDLQGMSLQNLDALVAFTLSLAAVSTGLPWRARILRFGGVLFAIYVLHVAATILQIKLLATQRMNDEYGLLLMLPLEFGIVERMKYLLYDVGLQWGPFVLVLLTIFWNATDGVVRPPARLRIPAERLVVSTVVALVLIAVGGFGWRAWRESHPLHVVAHGRMGYIYHQNGDIDDAVKHYKIAIEGNSDIPQVYFNLGAIMSEQGDTGDAVALMRLGLDRTSDPDWTPRFQQAIRTLSESPGQRSR